MRFPQARATFPQRSGARGLLLSYRPFRQGFPRSALPYLLLREAGIPVRYVEGYLASDVVKYLSAKEEWGYYSIVKDSDAHAWIEVWYDGIGWVSYETTPKFYNDAYGILVEDTDPDDIPDDTLPLPDDTYEEEPTDTEDITDIPIDTEPSDVIDDPNAESNIVATICVSTAVAVVLAAVIACVVYIKKRAEKHRKQKEKLLGDAENGSFSEEERHEIARRLIDMTTDLLRVFGTPPGKSEFREDYAKRLEKEYLKVFGKRKYVNNIASLTEEERAKLDGNDYYIVSDTDFTVIFDSIAAEEFGLAGMTREEIRNLAIFYKRLYTAMPDRLSSFAIFKHKYFKFI